MWTWHLQATADPSAYTATLRHDAETVTVAAFLDALLDDAAFRAFWTAQLRTIPFKAYCWEMPPLSPSRLEQPFECAFVESPMLARVVADASPFAEPFAQSAPAAAIATFENLGRDALLVAPKPLADAAVYPHLATFLRHGPAEQIDALWQQVAHAVQARLIEHSPLWLSTAGLGVHWLHVRLDDRPKYYRYSPYTALT